MIIDEYSLRRSRGEYLTNRFHVAVRLFSNRSQMTSKCGKNKKVAHEAIAECFTDFDVFCDLLLNRPTATWNLFVLYNKELNFIRIKADGDVNRASVL